MLVNELNAQQGGSQNLLNVHLWELQRWLYFQERNLSMSLICFTKK